MDSRVTEHIRPRRDLDRPLRETNGDEILFRNPHSVIRNKTASATGSTTNNKDKKQRPRFRYGLKNKQRQKFAIRNSQFAITEGCDE
jgi:hypothetical protein